MATAALQEQLLRCLRDQTGDTDLIAGIIGDRALTPREAARLERWRATRGAEFYSDVLFTLTHEHFPPDRAHELWERIVTHKQKLEQALGRSVSVEVATLDFFTHVDAELPPPTLISRPTLSDFAEIAMQDGTTGLFCRWAFRTLLEKEVARARRFDQPVSVMMLDLDDFKVVNDRYGHPVGDQVLATVSRMLRLTLRESDIVARYGGEEFAAVLPRSTTDHLGSLLERVREAIAADHAGLPRITASIGVACYPTDADSPSALVERADQALYEAKRAGKNRVAVAGR